MAVIETLTFRLAPGVDEETFLLADRAVQNEFIPNLRGFLRRTTSYSEDGEWLVVTLWASAQDAEACRTLLGKSPVVQRFSSLMADPSPTRRLYSTLD